VTLPRLTVCLPGSSFSGKWLAAWNELYGRLMLEYRVTLVYGEGNNIYEVRNDCLARVLETAMPPRCEEADAPEHVLWIDSDNVVSSAGFFALRASLDAVLNASAVGGWYLWQPFDADQPMIAAGTGEDRPRLKDIQGAAEVNALLEVEYIGFGFLLMKYRLIEDLGRRSFNPILREDGEFETDDVGFCLRAIAKKHRFYLHPHVHAPHLKLLPVPLTHRPLAVKPREERDERITGDQLGVGFRPDEGIHREGDWWVPLGDRSLPSLLDERGIYDHETAGVRKGDIVLDCGANVGVFTKSALAKGAELVVAIEPDPVTRAALFRNVNSAAVRVVGCGVWHSDTSLTLSRHEHFFSANSVVLVRGGENTQRVHVTTIDKIVEMQALDRVDFIKMDIEGAEKQALQGAADTIRRFRPRMAIACEHFVDDPERIQGLVQSIAPYRCSRRGDVLFFEPIFEGQEI
jgi:FkbM family methyltransferase